MSKLYITGDCHGDFQRFSTWFCGHYHVNQVIDERFVIQWEQISQIETDSI